MAYIKYTHFELGQILRLIGWTHLKKNHMLHFDAIGRFVRPFIYFVYVQKKKQQQISDPTHSHHFRMFWFLF